MKTDKVSYHNQHNDSIYKELRAMKNMDLKAYLEQAGKEVSQHTEVYQEIEKQVLEALGLEKNVLDKSIEYYMSTGNLEIIALMNLLGEKMKYLKIPGTKRS